MPEKIIEVPGMGTVSFPDSMSDDAIATAIKSSMRPPSTPDKGFGKTGTRLKSPAGQRDESILDWFPHMGEHLEKPSADTTAGIGSDLLRFFGMAASPAAVGPVLAHPGSAALGLGLGLPVQSGVQHLGEAVGAPGTGALAGDVLGGLAGAGASKVASTVSPYVGAVMENPVLRGQVARKIPGLKTALAVKDVITDFKGAPVKPVAPRLNWPPSAELPRLQPVKPGAPPPSAELPRIQPTKPGAPPPSAELPRLQPVQPGPPPPSAELPRLQPSKPGAPPPSAELPRLTGVTPVEGRPHWPPAYKPPTPPSSKGIKVDTQPIPIPEPTAKPQPIQPVAAAPTRYDEMVKIGGDVLATHGTTIDSAIAKYLKSKGYTPEDVMDMNEDSLYKLSKGGVPTLRKFGTSGKASRPFATRQKDIFDALSREWGR